MDGDTMYEETPPLEDHLRRIHADLATLSVDEKAQLVTEMGIALAEDFHTAWSDRHWLGKIAIVMYLYRLESLWQSNFSSILLPKEPKPLS